jgi:DegV family protein with EDD domain
MIRSSPSPIAEAERHLLTLAAARRIAERTGKRITVIDSRTLSGALGLLVLRLARRVDEGASHDAVAADAESALPNAKILVAVRTLKYMVRGGRVSPMAGAAANFLNLKPIVSMGENGETKIFDKAFSQRGSLRKILRRLRDETGTGRVRDYCILHAHNTGDALAYAVEAEKVFGEVWPRWISRPRSTARGRGGGRGLVPARR